MGLQSIAENAFADCINLSQVSLPDSLTKIGQYAFYACPKLLSVTLPAHMDKNMLGDYAFGYTDGTELDEQDRPIPVKIEGFKLHGGKGLSPMAIAIIVGAAAVLAVVIFLLVRVIRKNQLSREEQQEQKAAQEEAELQEEDKVYVNILDSMGMEPQEEDNTDYEQVSEETPDVSEDDE
jgi:hypothetical protein